MTRCAAGPRSIPAESRFTNRIHRDDAAAAIVHLCTMDPVPAPVYLGVDNEPAELGEVLRFLAAELGLPQPPSGTADAACSGGATAARRGGEPSRGGNKRCSNALLRSTGFEFRYPSFREGYRDILAGVGVRYP